MLQPALIKSAYTLVFILLDDCRIVEGSFDLSKIMKIMRQNNLTVASPMVS